MGVNPIRSAAKRVCMCFPWRFSTQQPLTCEMISAITGARALFRIRKLHWAHVSIIEKRSLVCAPRRTSILISSIKSKKPRLRAKTHARLERTRASHHYFISAARALFRFGELLLRTRERKHSGRNFLVASLYTQPTGSGRNYTSASLLAPPRLIFISLDSIHPFATCWW